MLVFLSVIDKHKPEGQRSVGAIIIDVPQIQTVDTHYEILALNAAVDVEPFVMPYVGALMDRGAVEAMDAAIKAGKSAPAKSRLYKPTYTATVKAEAIVAKELKPGDLFSTFGPSYWDGFEMRPSCGESAYIRTCASVDQFPDGDEMVYRLTVVREVHK